MTRLTQADWINKRNGDHYQAQWCVPLPHKYLVINSQDGKKEERWKEDKDGGGVGSKVNESNE